MAMEVVPHRAKDLAKSICGIDIQVYNGSHRWIVPGKGSVTPGEYIIAAGSTQKDFTDIFGLRLANGIEQTPIRQVEKKMEPRSNDCTTQCVQLMIPRDPASPSFLILALDQTQGWEIARELMITTHVAI